MVIRTVQEQGELFSPVSISIVNFCDEEEGHSIESRAKRAQDPTQGPWLGCKTERSKIDGPCLGRYI